MSFWTYILKCADDSYYVGQTDNLEKRLSAHEFGEPSCYTTSRRPLTLVWSQEFATREEALTAERQIKGWSRKKKEALIQGDWKQIKQYAWGTKNPLPEHLR
jgi:predicted GIY-YIG superfamily endonuclease